MDFLSDNNPKGLDNVIKNLGDKLPKYITDTNFELNKLASTAFADAKHREYPINNKANTWLSTAYFYSQGMQKISSEADRNLIANNLSMASAVYDIDNDIKEIFSVLKTSNDLVKKANVSESKYAISLTDNDSLRQYLPINTSEEIINSAYELNSFKEKISPYIFKQACKNIIKQANALHLDLEYLPNEIKESEKEYVFNYKLAKQFADNRFAQTKDPLYNEIVEFIKEASEDLDDDLYLYANELHNLDIAHKLPKSNSFLDDPFKMCFNGEELNKKKFAKANSIIICNIDIPSTEILNDNVKDKVKNYFGTKTASEIISILDSKKSNSEISKDLNKFASSIQYDFLRLLLD